MALPLGFIFANLSTPCSIFGGVLFLQDSFYLWDSCRPLTPTAKPTWIGKGPLGRFQMPTWSGELEACWLVK